MSELILTNIQSLKPKKNIILHYILQHKLDLCFITEMWIPKMKICNIKANLMAQSFNILSCETKNRNGGGLAYIYNYRFKMKLLVPQNYESFESLTVQCNIKSKTKLFSLIYRPPSSTKNGSPVRIFLDEFSEHITLLQQNDDPIILGDINILWNKENIDRESLLEIMDLYNLKQHVLIKTHKQGNTLNWIISKENSTTISRIQEGDYLSDHCTITWTHKVEKQPVEKINHTSRNFKSIPAGIAQSQLG